VNIIDADITIVSSIALDHVDWLGNTRELIAVEKRVFFDRVNRRFAVMPRRRLV